MPHLEYVPLPERRFGAQNADGPYLYEKYVPLVNEFIRSGEPSAMVVHDGTCTLTQLEAAVFHSEDRLAVDARTRSGKFYLVRK